MNQNLRNQDFHLFKLVFAYNTILSCSFLFFLIFDLNFLFPTVITKIFNPAAELIMVIWIPTKEVKSEIETHPVISGGKISV